MNEILPSPVYALLTGLNSSTVGIIALSAVQLAEKAIKDDVTRIIVIFGACAGMCHNALWYFPVLMVVGGLATFLWDGHMKPAIARFRARRMRASSPEGFVQDTAEPDVLPLREEVASVGLVQRKPNGSSSREQIAVDPSTSNIRPRQQSEIAPEKHHTIQIRVGVALLIAFFSE